MLTEPNPILLPNSTQCWIIHGTPTGANIGLTVPNFKLVKNNVKGGINATALVVLDSGRGLIIIANRAKFYLLKRETGCWDMNNFNNFPERDKNQPKIGMGLIRNTLLHELSAHAGLFSQNLPAFHNSNRNSRVEKNVSDIDNLDKDFSSENVKLFNEVQKEFEFLRSADVSP